MLISTCMVFLRIRLPGLPTSSRPLTTVQPLGQEEDDVGMAHLVQDRPHICRPITCKAVTGYVGLRVWGLGKKVDLGGVKCKVQHCRA